ncbi:MAG: glycosyl hydrolase [Gemmatimonadaceae bacterium]|nr:glycosyl hydrolase [Gemmatimonadaceae bacterium]
MRPVRTLAFAFTALSLGASLASAQRTRPAAPQQAVGAPAYDPTLYTAPSATSARFKSLRWRNVGPIRGGRVVAVAGDPTRPFVFYHGSVNGGVWKTTNGGQSWNNVTDGTTDISSVGAIAAAPSDPNVIYVGTGESQLREDLTFGTGVYRSTDAGQTWKHLGLTDTHQITDVVIDPRNPDRVFVSAIGHAFGPNAERGVFRTTDGGKSWAKVLFINDSTGANDLSMDPSNPRIIYASFWKFQRTPWSMNAGGGRSGIWKTADGGDTWTEITFNPGIPRTPLGKIGLDVSPANPRRIYASIEAPDSSGGIFRSDDAGDTWQRMNTDPRFWVRAWYYSAVTADPTDENTVYVMNLQVMRSIDGGKTFTVVRVPHGDTHPLWIDPKDNRRMINGNDGGAQVSFDQGATWSTMYNQPTAQFYHVTTDNQWPYRIYGAQQDNSAVSVMSRSDDGSIGERDYYSVAGCENATVAVDPRDPMITYGGCYMGSFSRYDHRTRQERDISVGLRNFDGWGAKDVPHRFQWTFPVLISPHDPKTLYVTSQHVWRSTTEGASWERISPDLTTADPKTLERTGGPIHGEMTGAEWYATIYAFMESPRQKGVLWAGSDDGKVHVSRDNGTTWQDVTPPGYGRLTRTAHIDPSPHDPAVAYIAANRYQQDDFAPSLWKTADYGRTWTKIVRGLPANAYSRVVREDPKRRGLLYSGSELGVHVSFDDGATWEPLQLNLPRVSVRDLKVHDNDLIAATHGRAFWVIDDLSPLRQLADSVTSKRMHLFQPATAVRWRGGSRGINTAGANPAGGAYIDYWFAAKPTAKVTLQFLDGSGKVLRSFDSEGKADTAMGARDSLARRADATRADSLAYMPGTDKVPARAGGNRFAWNLQVEDAKKMDNTVIDEGHLGGPMVPPGQYTARLIAGSDTLTHHFEVIADPRIAAITTTADLQAQYAAALRVQERINEIVENTQRTEDIQKQIDGKVQQTKDQAYAARVDSAAKAVRGRFESVREELYEIACHVDQCTLDQPVKLYNWFITLNAQVQQGDFAPTRQHGEIYDQLNTKLQVQLQRLQRLEAEDLAAFNRLLQELGVPNVFVAPRKPIS